MNEINTKPEDTKICLKCKRGLRSGQHKCNFCGCKDTMNKNKYYELINRYKQADDTIKQQIKNNPKLGGGTEVFY